MIKHFRSLPWAKVTHQAQHKVLSSALIWFGIGFAIVFGMAFAFTRVSFFEQLFIRIASSRGGVLTITLGTLGLLLVISFGAMRLRLETLIGLYLVLCFLLSFMMGFVFSAYAQRNSELLLVFMIPAVTFAGMGALGYFQVFNFGRLWGFLLISMIGLLVFGVVLIFVQSSFLYKVFSGIGYVLFSLYVGFDMWRISRLDQLYNLSENPDRTMVTRFGLLFGMFLLIDFIQMVWFMAQLLGGGRV